MQFFRLCVCVFLIIYVWFPMDAGVTERQTDNHSMQARILSHDPGFLVVSYLYKHSHEGRLDAESMVKVHFEQARRSLVLWLRNSCKKRVHTYLYKFVHLGHHAPRSRIEAVFKSRNVVYSVYIIFVLGCSMPFKTFLDEARVLSG